MTDEEKRLQEQGVFDTAVAAVNADKPTYAGTFDQQLQDIYDRIANREKFNYDVNADPLYQQYKDQYIQGGKLAMKDTMGQAAALTGGYGSSYGQQVGQQAYDAYLQKLSAAIPELYGMALDKYNQEGQDLLTQYGLLGQQRDTEYGQYRDQLGDWMTERDYQHQMANEQYDKQQKAYSNLYAMIMSAGYMPSAEELAAAGMSSEQANALRQSYITSNPQAAWMNGMISGEDFWKLTGQYPTGYTPPSTGGGGGGDWGVYYGSGSSDTASAGNTDYTFADVAKAYSNAKSTGNNKDANLILQYAANNDVISQDDKKYIFKNYQVKDRL